MTFTAEHPPLSQLCYLDAEKVKSPVGMLSELFLVTADGEKLGSIAGVVIEAVARRVRYYVVQSASWLRPRRYLVESDQLAQVDPEHKLLRLVGSEMTEVSDLDVTALRQFSDDDLLAALFAPRAA